MRGFEQAISKPRYHLTQFHRPAMLKLETVGATGLMEDYSAAPFRALWILFYFG